MFIISWNNQFPILYGKFSRRHIISQNNHTERVRTKTTAKTRNQMSPVISERQPGAKPGLLLHVPSLTKTCIELPPLLCLHSTSGSATHAASEGRVVVRRQLVKRKKTSDKNLPIEMFFLLLIQYHLKITWELYQVVMQFIGLICIYTHHHE